MQLPGPVRALVGLVATAANEAKHLPDRAIELPMLAVSSALQMSLRAQQRYAKLAARGDDVINRRPPTDEPPAWATFDDPISIEEFRNAGTSMGDHALRARAASQLLDELLGRDTDRPADEPTPTVTSIADRVATKKAPATKAPAKKAPARKAPAKTAATSTAPAKKAPAKNTPTKKAATSKSPSRKAPEKKAAAKRAPAKKAAARTTSAAATPSDDDAKQINAPRHTSPSRFDTVDE